MGRWTGAKELLQGTQKELPGSSQDALVERKRDVEVASGGRGGREEEGEEV